MTFHGAREVGAYPVTYYRGPDAHALHIIPGTLETRAGTFLFIWRRPILLPVRLPFPPVSSMLIIRNNRIIICCNIII